MKKDKINLMKELKKEKPKDLMKKEIQLGIGLAGLSLGIKAIKNI